MTPCRWGIPCAQPPLPPRKARLVCAFTATVVYTVGGAASLSALVMAGDLLSKRLTGWDCDLGKREDRPCRCYCFRQSEPPFRQRQAQTDIFVAILILLTILTYYVAVLYLLIILTYNGGVGIGFLLCNCYHLGSPLQKVGRLAANVGQYGQAETAPPIEPHESS